MFTFRVDRWHNYLIALDLVGSFQLVFCLQIPINPYSDFSEFRNIGPGRFAPGHFAPGHSEISGCETPGCEMFMSDISRFETSMLNERVRNAHF